MSASATNMDKVTFEPATAANWSLLTGLFDSVGEASKCYCAYYYLTNAAYQSGRSGANKAWFKEQTEDDAFRPGVLALSQGRAVGWCGVAPRWDQSRLGRSRVLAPIDQEQVHSMTCFVVARDWRRKGLMRRLIEAGVDHAVDQGASIVEAYPIQDQGKGYPGDLHTGSLAAFLDCGFDEVARRSPRRPIVRRHIPLG